MEILSVFWSSQLCCKAQVLWGAVTPLHQALGAEAAVGAAQFWLFPPHTLDHFPGSCPLSGGSRGPASLTEGQRGGLEQDPRTFILGWEVGQRQSLVVVTSKDASLFCPRPLLHPLH